MNSIDSINGMTHTEATKLRRARVRTTTTFLQIASSRSGRALLTKETGISSPKLLHWARRAELMKIKNLGRDYADLLEAAGCLLYTSPSPRDGLLSRMPSSA